MMTKILLVEDNDMNRDMLSRRLTRRGFDVSIAVDGEEALEMVANETPDLVLMDLSLPVMDGWEATRQIKSRPRFEDTPIIALTAHALETDREKALEIGCDEFETKPVDLNGLLDKIDRLVGKSAAE
jgi:CheY-like chemotaxis protein